jgi:formate-dependent nitrite reductase membrane component NrfD
MIAVVVPVVPAGQAFPAIPPAGMAIAALTVMLWLIWSDTVRTGRTPAVLYAVRVALFVIVTGILVLNRIRYPFLFSPTATVLVVVDALVSAGGAIYFARRLVRRD